LNGSIMRWQWQAGVCALAMTIAGAATANSWDLGPGWTGAPHVAGGGAEADCSACHAGTNPDRASDARVELEGLPSPYLPGVRYTLTLAIEHPDADRLRWGFALTPFAAKRPIDSGRLIATDRENTALRKGDGRSTLVHTYPGTAIGQGGGQRWTFDWVAPLSDVGEIAFFARLVAADADGTEHGDLVYGATPLAVIRGPATAREAERAATADPPASEEP
jgi:hypothetical protein